MALLFIPKRNTSDSISKKQREGKIILFNRLFPLSVRILKLLKQHFPKSNRLPKIFNKNTVKACYSCMSNLSSIILSHDKRHYDLKSPSMVATAEREETAHCKINVLCRT